MNADQIMVLRQERILERSTHAELLTSVRAYGRALAQQLNAVGGASAQLSAPVA